MLRSTEDIANSEFEDEMPDIKSKLPMFSRQLFDGMRLMQVSEKLFDLVTIEVEFKNHMGRLPDNFYKEWNGEEKLLHNRPVNEISAFHPHIQNNLVFDVKSCLVKCNTLSEGKAEFTYYAIPYDDDGFAAITEQHGLDIAMCAYLRYRHVRSQYYAGQVGLERKREAYLDFTTIAAAVRGDSKMPDPEKLFRIISQRKRYS